MLFSRSTSVYMLIMRYLAVTFMRDAARPPILQPMSASRLSVGSGGHLYSFGLASCYIPRVPFSFRQTGP